MKEIKGDLFDRIADAICITTNGEVDKQGLAIMGRGVALEAKKRWPEVAVSIGVAIQTFGNAVFLLTDEQKRLISTGRQLPYHLFTFPTKFKWREKSDLGLIQRSAAKLRPLTSLMNNVVIPRPGCSNGGLRWEDVKPILEVELPGSQYQIISPLGVEDL